MTLGDEHSVTLEKKEVLVVVSASDDNDEVMPECQVLVGEWFTCQVISLTHTQSLTVSQFVHYRLQLQFSLTVYPSWVSKHRLILYSKLCRINEEEHSHTQLEESEMTVPLTIEPTDVDMVLLSIGTRRREVGTKPAVVLGAEDVIRVVIHDQSLLGQYQVDRLPPSAEIGLEVELRYGNGYHVPRELQTRRLVRFVTSDTSRAPTLIGSFRLPVLSPHKEYSLVITDDDGKEYLTDPFTLTATKRSFLASLGSSPNLPTLS
jgi:hypothetical protein